MKKVLVKTILFWAVSIIMLVVKPAFADTVDTEQPSLEFLEFLGEFETQNGMWVDPLSLLGIDETESDTKSGEEDQDEE